MADFTAFNTALADLKAKVDAFNAKPAPPVPVDDQPSVDAATAAVVAITATIPA